MLVQENHIRRTHWTDSSNCKGQKMEQVGSDSRPPAPLPGRVVGWGAGRGALLFQPAVLCVTKGQLCLFPDLIAPAVGVTVIARFH